MKKDRSSSDLHASGKEPTWLAKLAKNKGRAAATLLLGAAGMYAGVALYEAETADQATGQAATKAAPQYAASHAGQDSALIPASFSGSALSSPFSRSAAPIMTNAILDAGQALQHADTQQAATMMNAGMELPADFIPNSANGSTENAPFSHINLPELSSGRRAIELLGANLDEVAAWYGMTPSSFKQLLLSDSSVHVDRKGRVLHVDSGVTAIPAGTQAGNTASATTTATATASTPFPLDQTFKLHSKPDSTRVIYINFTGQGSNPAFDLDKAPSTFSNAERLLIQNVWLRVVEDYAAFDVDITTEAPAVPKGKIGATVLITPQTSSAGGYAYLNSFSAFAAGNAPAFCFPNNLANSEKPIAECVSHESGHTLGLKHQGSSSTEYYGGQGDGETGWAPIMGVSYYKNLTQWAKGEYNGANNKEDAYAVMLKQGLKPRTADHGNTVPFADPLTATSANGLNNLSGSGIIETPGNTDMFSFVAGAGSISLKLTGAALGSDLDASLQITDVNGKVLATSNPTATLASSITATLPAQGTYFLSVTGVGKGDSKTTGYSNYGSLGQYTISGTAPLNTAAQAVAAIKASATTGTGSLAVTFDASASKLDGGKINSYTWNFGDGSAAVSGAIVKYTYTKVGSFDAVLKIVDSKGITTYKGIKITVNAKV